MKQILSRRQLLEACLASGALRIVARAQDGAPLAPTPENQVGPFYKKGSPRTAMLRQAGDNGVPLRVKGRILNVRGEAVADARVEVWQADHVGKYDLAGQRYRAQLPLSEKGEYAFESVMPGHYPDRVCQHIHYLVTAPGHKPLVTQLYFGTDPVFEGNPDKHFGKDPLILSRELVRPVTLYERPGEMHAEVLFELVLRKA